VPGLQQPKVFIHHILPGAATATWRSLLSMWNTTDGQNLYIHAAPPTLAKTGNVNGPR
jgi:hypothetical protein